MTVIVFQILLIFFSVKSNAQSNEFGRILPANVVDENYIISRALGRDPNKIFCEKELKQLFESFGRNESENVDAIYTLLEHMDFPHESIQSCPTTKTSIKINIVPDRIKENGYPAEVHTVRTEDGYRLRMHRIPYGRKSIKTDKHRPPVFIMHGFLESSNGWTVLGVDNSLEQSCSLFSFRKAYLLADIGYDVWLGNARGTEPSLEHDELDANGSNNREYWSFSWHEIGFYDLPAFIDHILNETNSKNLTFVGFSQGTTAFLVLTSMRPEYNDKFLQANLLAPVAFMKNTKSILYNAIAFLYKPLKKVLEIFRVYRFSIDHQFAWKVIEMACNTITALPYIFELTPASVSVRQSIHFIQQIRHGGFRQFDYDDIKLNREKYGSDTPPEYDLSRITVPVNIIGSSNDDTADVENISRLIKLLPNVKLKMLVGLDNFHHMDFTYSRHARLAVNNKIMQVINKANQMG